MADSCSTATTTTTDTTDTTETTTTTTTTTTTSESSDEGATFILLGGTGFIGRNLVDYLITNKLASAITVADKAMPATSYLNAAHKKLFASDIVTFKQSDLAKDDHVARVFKDKKYDYVINLCGETRFGLTEHDYKIRCEQPAIKCSKAALANKSKRYVEVSTAQVYVPTKTPANEEAKLEPWTVLSKYRLAAEEAVQKVKDLPWVILRPAICYGVGDLTGISPRATCAAVYQKTGKKMEFLWTKDLGMNTVHVSDLCAAIWTACTELKPKTIYNVADPCDTTQGNINEVLGELFNIKTGFKGATISNVVSMQLSAAADYVNDMHVPEWTRMCQEAKIMNTPLTPYIDKELLYKKHFKVNGEKITKDSSFTYKVKFSKDSVKEQISAFIEQKIFPPAKLS